MAKEAVNKAVKSKVKKSKPRKFFRETMAEVKKVTWPSRKELTNYTIAVIALIIIFAVIIGIVDYGLTQLLNLVTY